jgi:hypothetical protein
MRTCGAAVLTVCAGLLAAGCGGPPPEKFVTVSGRVTVGGKPLSTGQIGFVPDESAGNPHPEYPTAAIQSDGTFTLATNDKAGVRPGWYKVVVWAWAEPVPLAPVYDANGQLKSYRSHVAAKYSKRETTDLKVEVVENPAAGAYDFALSPP